MLRIALAPAQKSKRIFMEKIVSLISPIEAHGEKLTELKLRRPTTDELIIHGQPYIVLPSGGGAVKADYRACAGLICAICAIPPSALAKIDAADFDELAMVLVGFTRGGLGAGKTAPGSRAPS
jgi:hypothetical protein